MNLKGLLGLFSVLSLAVFFSCTKLNEATELGDDLIPAVDNINTFDTVITVNTAYYPFDDSVKHLLGENMALGKLNDPLFGTTTADMYFNLSSAVYSTHPFVNRNAPSFRIDSVVLSLDYEFTYGDSLNGTSQLSVQVEEIQAGNGFVDTMLYRYDHPGFTTGGSLGTRTFSIPELRNSFKIGGRKSTDSVTVSNVLRIKLDNSIGEKLRGFDTVAGQPYSSDTAFRRAFRGLAVKTISAPGIGTLAYFNLSNTTNTRLTVYYHSGVSGPSDTSSAVFAHTTYSQANSIRRTAGGSYLAGLGNPSSQSLYIQSSPQGSYAGIKIPNLEAFPNRVIHRAELIIPKLSSASENTFAVPTRLYLDHKGTNSSKDSAYVFDNDIQLGSEGAVNFASFGGTLRSDNTYRFNLTRYVQGIVTRDDRNDSLRLYAPLRSTQYSRNVGGVISLPITSNIAIGRVVVASGSPANGDNRMRLRIIYSNL